MTKNSFDSFKLGDDILKALNLLEYKEPTKVQREVIPLALKDKDLVVKSQTGSGKTAAFGIPICENIVVKEKNPKALILTPTRELCAQIKEDLTNIGRFKRIRCAAIFGKQPVHIQVEELKQRVHIVAGTPGRTLDLIERESLNVSEIRYLVIDEADKMLDMGFIEQVEEIIKKLPKHRVTMLFSATISEEIEALCQKYMNNTKNIEISVEDTNSQNIKQFVYKVSEDNKLELLKDIIYVENPDSLIIFCSTKEKVDKTAQSMKDIGISCKALHGGMLQDDRLNIMKSFKKGEFRFLVATDVAARGIDIESLTHIINYDIPMEKESYVHRIGRTGRAGKEGKAITFVTPYEDKYLNQIEEYIDHKIPQGTVFSKEEVEKGKRIFEEKSNKKPKIKADKGEKLNKEIMKLYIGAGKRKKIRPGDIVGAITSIEGVSAEDIGVIDIRDNMSYVDILDGKGKLVYEGLKNSTIKGKTVKVEKAVK